MQTKKILIVSMSVVLLFISGGISLVLVLPWHIVPNSRQEQTSPPSQPSVASGTAENIDGLRILGDQADHLREMDTRLAEYIHTLRPTAPGESLVEQAHHARYWVAIYLTKGDETTKQHLTEALTRVGYTVTPGEVLHLQLADSEQRSSVFYFHDDSFGAADELAKLMGRLTGGTFDVRHGSHLPIPPDQERWTFVVHHIGGG
ncbi:hypothetical protein CCP3SC15_1060003 [Gammaproteobacteria bacterium]